MGFANTFPCRQKPHQTVLEELRTFPCHQKPHQTVLEELGTGLVPQQLLGLVVQHTVLAELRSLEAARKNHPLLAETAGARMKGGPVVEPELPPELASEAVVHMSHHHPRRPFACSEHACVGQGRCFASHCEVSFGRHSAVSASRTAATSGSLVLFSGDTLASGHSPAFPG